MAETPAAAPAAASANAECTVIQTCHLSVAGAGYIEVQGSLATVSKTASEATAMELVLVGDKFGLRSWLQPPRYLSCKNSPDGVRVTFQNTACGVTELHQLIRPVRAGGNVLVFRRYQEGAHVYLQVSPDGLTVGFQEKYTRRCLLELHPIPEQDLLLWTRESAQSPSNYRFSRSFSDLPVMTGMDSHQSSGTSLLDPEFTPSDNGSALVMNDQERERQEIIRTIIEEEAQFLDGMRIISEMYAARLYADITAQEAATLFSNITDLQVLSQELCDAYSQRRTESEGGIRLFADILLTKAKGATEAYGIYCAGRSAAKRVLDQLRTRNFEVAAFLEEQHDETGYSLEDLLQKPVEHIKHIVQRLQHLQQVMPTGHADYANTETTLAEFETVAPSGVTERANADLPPMAFFERGIEWPSSLVPNPSFSLVEPNRRLFHAGPLEYFQNQSADGGKKKFSTFQTLRKTLTGKSSRTTIDVTCFLFNDLFVAAAKHKKGKYQAVLPPIELANASVDASSGDDGMVQLDADGAMFLFRAAATEDAIDWIRIMKKTIAACNKAFHKKQEEAAMF